MWSFLTNAILWTLAFYGMFEIIKTLIYLYYFSKSSSEKDTYVVVCVKGNEKNIEVFLRSIIFRTLYGNDNYIDEILVLNLGVAKETKDVIEKIQQDYECVKMIEFDEFEKILKR